MDGQVFITQGDITRLCADAIAVTRGVAFSRFTENFSFLNDMAGDPTAGEDLHTLRRRAREEASRQPPPQQQGTYWVPFAGAVPPRPQGVVFVSNLRRGLSDSDEDHPAYRMVKTAVDMAVANLRRIRQQSNPSSVLEEPRAPDTKSPPRRFLIALVAFRMGAGGDRHDRLRSALPQIRAAYDALNEYPDIDIAFILDDRAKYEVFLEARRRYLTRAGRPRPPFDAPAVADLIQAIKEGECVVFVGAGFSANSGLTGYRALMQKMADELGIRGDVGGEQDTYLDIAQLYRDERGNEAVKALVSDLFGVAARALPSLAHYLLLSLPGLRFVVTTNYDYLIEQAMEALHRYPIQVLDERQVAETGYRDGTFVVKFHGDARAGRIILSRDDYDGFFRDRPEMASLLEGLLLNQTFFFVGYSLRDPNFRQIYGKIGLMLRSALRPAYVTSLETTHPVLRQHLERRRLRLLDLSGAAESDVDAGDSPDEKRRRLLYLLDRLGEAVSDASRLFLAPESLAPLIPSGATRRLVGRLDDVRAELLTVGHRLMEAILAGGLEADEVRMAARILSLLAEMGWRPGRVDALERWRAADVSLEELWRRLAGQSPESSEEPGRRRERRQLLVSALRFAENLAGARDLQRLIREHDDVSRAIGEATVEKNDSLSGRDGKEEHG
jgi:hypothetical protein